MNNDPEIMTIDEVAHYLRVSERTVYDWANKGEIPAGKIGTTWRFKRSEIEQWVDRKLKAEPPRAESRPLSLEHLVSRERVLILDAATKVDALNHLIDNLAQAPQVKDRNALAEAIFRREEMMSTGIGMGVAVPHVRIPSVSDLVMSVAVNRRDLTDYESLDGIPVRLLFMIAARPDQHAQHIKTLASIGRLVKSHDTVQHILHAENEDELYRLLTS